MKNIVISDFNDDLVHANKALFKRNKHKLFWDGYTLVEFIPSKRAERDPQGAFHDGEYGFTKRIEVSKNGTWIV